LLVWHFYHAALASCEGGMRALLDRCGQALELLTFDLQRFAQVHYRLSRS